MSRLPKQTMVKHGSYTRYSYGCRCDLCRQACRAYFKEHPYHRSEKAKLYGQTIRNKRRRIRYAIDPEYKLKLMSYNKAKRALSGKKWYHNRKLKAYAVLGSCCARCGNTDYRVLQIDHIHNDGYLIRRAKDRRSILSEIIEHNPSDKYQLLCANCHAIKTWHEPRVGS